MLQKMMTSQKTNRKDEYSQGISICDQLNLNIEKLVIQQLMANTTYRRLYNIVKNDMSRSELSFRKNLIKELYFLLQITPVIKQELKDHFLMEVQKWYNLNDHKKIDLASNKMNKLLNIVSHSKKESTISGGLERPKSSVVWNQNVSPFLRPYTATRERKEPKSKLRPQSSKFGNQSTKVETNDEICIRDFTTNIQQQLEISQDFLQKHRTNHPDYQPTYEQLYNILKRVETSAAEVQSPRKDSKQPRTIKSAVPYNQRAITLIRQQGNHQSQNLIPDEGQLQNEQGQRESSQSSEQQLIYSSNKKQYRAFSREIKIVEKESAIKHEQDNLDKYSHCIQNKLIQALREDREMAGRYVNYTKLKTTMRTEMNRKLESKRLFSANHVTMKRSQFSINEPIKNEEKQNVPFDFIDLTKDPLNKQADKINPHPTYNKRSVLNNLYQAPVKLFKKLNTPTPPKPMSNTLKRPLTACVRFHSAVKFDPLSNDNVKQHNNEVLEEIEKIKLKMGGHCSASTESLMKALYIDAYDDEPAANWQSLNPYFGMISIGKEKKLKKKGRKLKTKAK